MQNNKFHYCLHILPILFFMAFVSASCIKDDLSDCPAPRTSGFSLQVKAFDADGGSLGSETIKDITLYIFDADKALLDTRNILLSEIVFLDYPGHDNLKLVAWGNGKQGAQSMPATPPFNKPFKSMEITSRVAGHPYPWQARLTSCSTAL